MQRSGEKGDLALYAGAASFAALNAAYARLWPHQRWGVWAVWGCGVGVVASIAMVALAHRSPGSVRTSTRAAVLVVVVAISVVAPLWVLASERADGVIGRAQSEVGVVEGMGDRLGHGDSVYPSARQIRDDARRSGVGFKGYAPYEPMMAVFGLPRAWAGRSAATDARVAFLLVGAGAAAAAMVVSGMDADRRLRAVQALAVLPPTALTIATGGDDMPVIGLCLLGLALASRRRWWQAGIVMGLAVAMKAIAAPVAFLLVVWVIRSRRGPEGAEDRSRALRALVTGLVGVPLVTILPFVVSSPAALWDNLVRYPLGLATFRSTAASPLPGHWIVEHVPGGHAITVILMAGVAVSVGWRILRRPPASIAGVAMLSAIGLAGAVLAAPASRFGYLLYPICLVAWGRLWQRSESEGAPSSAPITASPVTGSSARPAR